MRILGNVGVLGLAVGAALAWGQAPKGPSPVPTDERVWKDEQGLIRIRPLLIPADAQNPAWAPELETAFWQRANKVMSNAAGTDARTTGEGEKWSYPQNMLRFLNGDRAGALEMLQAPDLEAGDHAHTNGIDYYWCFTLKGQVRKYFFFGQYLNPDYRQKMFDGAKAWTAEDPRPNFELILSLTSPNETVRKYALASLQKLKAEYEKETGKTTPDFGADLAQWRKWWRGYSDQGWEVFEDVERLMNTRTHPIYKKGFAGAIGKDFSPNARGYWVDGRNTDNLRAMRETSVYLMAEETGNETVRLLYADKLHHYVNALYTIGMGEWDSENYIAHTIMPYHNLYDCAKDPQVRMQAKAALDWLYTALALKYYRGGMGGPTKRDYGGASRPFGSSAASLMWLMAGDSPVEQRTWHHDEIHAVTSGYRPPRAVIAVALKDFPKPVEMWDTKPEYSNWLPGADEKPEFFETMYYSAHHYLGTVVSAGASSDVGAFKLLSHHDTRGVEYFLAGSKLNGKMAGEQMGQYRNLCVFLTKHGKVNFQWPKAAQVQYDEGVWWIGLEKSYLAVRPIALERPAPGSGKVDTADQIMSANGVGSGLRGFALETGDRDQFKTMDDFRKAVSGKGAFTFAADKGVATLTGSDGRKLEVTYNKETDFPQVVRDGIARQWDKEFDLYKPIGSTAPVSLGWKKGTLRVEAGGEVFTQTLDEQRQVKFTITPAAP